MKFSSMLDKSQIPQLAPLSPRFIKPVLMYKRDSISTKALSMLVLKTLLAPLSKNVWLLLKAANTVFALAQDWLPKAISSTCYQLAIMSSVVMMSMVALIDCLKKFGSAMV
jgi:hypothetical protein